MIGPWKRLKIVWYRHQAKRAIWFMRYIDVMAHSVGWNRTKIRQMWRDFLEKPATRQATLDQLAVVNKITIKRAKRSRLQMSADIMYGKLARASFENQALRERLGELPIEFVEGLIHAIDDGESIDNLLGSYGVTIGKAEEAQDEVPAV